MDENDLITALDDHAADVPVGPAPIDRMTTTATRTRRRRGLAMGVAAAAVLAIGAVGVVQALPDDDPSDRAPVAGDDNRSDGDGVSVASDPPAEPDTPPEGYRYVGMNGVAIAVPEEWPTNEVQCNGVPKVSTVEIDPSDVACFMFSVFPADTDAVTVAKATGLDVMGWTPVEVAGQEALRSPTSTSEPDPTLGGDPVTSAQVLVVDQGVVFTVESSVSPERVDELLGGIVVLEDHVGVPGYADLARSRPSPVENYQRRLEGLGLEVELAPQLDRMARSKGEIIAVDPAPGTLVEKGSVVTVQAAAT